MFDDYQIPAIALIAALMLAFAYLHLRFRSVRTLLWILALGCAELQAILIWLLSHLTGTIMAPNSAAHIAMSVVGETALMLSSALFLASLSPLSFRIGRFRMLFVVPYTIPLLLYSVLYYGFPQLNPAHMIWVYCILACWAVNIAFAWSLQKGAMPVWLAMVVVIFAACISLPSFLHGDVYFPLVLVESGNMLMAALLVVYTFPRLSPGVLLAAIGFVVWALPPFFMTQPWNVDSFSGPPMIGKIFVRVFILGKVIVAMGLILLVLEDEVEKNQTAQQRERRVRLELEAYARQTLSARSLEEFDRESARLCSMIVEHSRFAGAALVVRGSSGAYRLVGYAGMDGAIAGALDSLVQRLPQSCFVTGSEPLVEDSTSLDLDLAPWLTPGDDLERLHLTRVGAVPMLGTGLDQANAPDGALLLTACREPLQKLRADDLLPLEILAGRLQSARTQAMMLGKLIDSERFAGVGQLATNVAQQLNNPLTVILGYSALLEDSTSSGADHRGAEAIGAEARRMKSILERLSRFSRLTTERFNSFSVADLITDIEQLHRPDFLRHSIEFRLSVAPSLPAIFGNPHQIRQALLHVTRFAIESVLRLGPNEAKAIRIEATSSAPEQESVQITVSHSGPGFPNPDRAFDSLSSGFSNNEPAGIGLSLCATIVRDHRGAIRAVNHHPTGAAVIITLPVS
jgi:signal transduction histidine kinase